MKVVNRKPYYSNTDTTTCLRYQMEKSDSRRRVWKLEMPILRRPLLENIGTRMKKDFYYCNKGGWIWAKFSSSCGCRVFQNKKIKIVLTKDNSLWHATNWQHVEM
jgi:hypothetical protein